MYTIVRTVVVRIVDRFIIINSSVTLLSLEGMGPKKKDKKKAKAEEVVVEESGGWVAVMS